MSLRPWIVMGAAVWLVLMLIIASTACGSRNTPYDAPRVGEGGVAQVLGVERFTREWEFGDDAEIVIYHVVLDDGRACDQVFIHLPISLHPDQWMNLTHQRQPLLGVLATDHQSAPYALCLKATVQ